MITAKDLYNIVDNFPMTKSSDILTRRSQDKGYRIELLHFKESMSVSFEITKELVDKEYQLSKDTIIYVEGLEYKFRCYTTSYNGYPHIDVYDAYKYLVMEGKIGEFILTSCDSDHISTKIEQPWGNCEGALFIMIKDGNLVSSSLKEIQDGGVWQLGNFPDFDIRVYLTNELRDNKRKNIGKFVQNINQYLIKPIEI